MKNKLKPNNKIDKAKDVVVRFLEITSTPTPPIFLQKKIIEKLSGKK